MVYNELRMRFSRLWLAPFLAVAAGCGSTLQPVPDGWRSVPATAAVSAAETRRALTTGAPVAVPEQAKASTAVRIVVEADGARLFRDATPLTPTYKAIESFDVSAEREEVVFSAKRESNFDIGLVAVEGSQVNWIPEDPADEVAPIWAPRGNKASFVVRNRGGDLIRTVHIPTAFQLVVDFPFGVVNEVVWDGPAERFAVVWETADASPRIEVMKYSGEGRRVAVPPAVRLAVTTTPMAGGLIMRPSSVTYNERLPLIIWMAEGERNRWDDARGALLSASRAAALVLDRRPDEDLAALLREAGWVDPARVYVVNAKGVAPPLPGAVVISGDRSVPSGYYRREGRAISTHPSDVKSFAARFIAGELKGTPPRGR